MTSSPTPTTSVASPFASNVSGFAAPVGGYSIDGPAESPEVTAELIWIALREAGKKVAAATFPGADGLDIRIPGLANSPIVQRAAERTVDYTVPFGAFAGIGAQGFSLRASDFSAAPTSTVNQLVQAGRAFFSPVLQKTTSLETFTVGGVAYDIRVAALDTTNDARVNYDTLVFFDARQGILPGPFSLPSTGPAYVRAADQRSAPFYLEGSSSKAGVGFYVSQLAPDLSTVRIARYSANSIPRNPAVLADVDDVNTRVGFWAPQPDFRIPERLSPGFGPFPDLELEAIYADLVKSFVDYQTRVALRAIERLPNADLLMLYIEQPDGSGHQFLLEDPRQPTDFTNPASIGAGQDAGKIARYRAYREASYQAASRAVQRIVDAVGTDAGGRPRSNIIVVSDHGFETFHTAVNMAAFLASQGFDPAKVRAVTSGPATNVYINLQGREPNGTVGRAEYLLLQEQIASALASLADTNPNYTNGASGVPVFDKIYRRPVPADITDPSFGRGTSEFIGQDSGDVSALLTVGYNFDGTQSPVVQRLGDAPATLPVLSLPNFYGAHGYDPLLPNMSAILIAAGPDIRPGSLTRARNIDVAPTIGRLLGVKPASLVDGSALPVRLLRRVQTSLIDSLQRLLPTGDKKLDGQIAKAVRSLQLSLDARLWADDSHLTGQGQRVFKDARNAVSALSSPATGSAAVAQALDGIVAVAEELAAIAIDEAVAAGGDAAKLGHAKAQMLDASTAIAAGRLADAVHHYRQAWDYASRAATRLISTR